jgi:hypothetical protein
MYKTVVGKYVRQTRWNQKEKQRNLQLMLETSTLIDMLIILLMIRQKCQQGCRRTQHYQLIGSY